MEEDKNMRIKSMLWTLYVGFVFIKEIFVSAYNTWRNKEGR